MGVVAAINFRSADGKTVNLTKPNICSIFNYNKYITKPASQQIERSETSESRRHSIYHNHPASTFLPVVLRFSFTFFLHV